MKNFLMVAAISLLVILPISSNAKEASPTLYAISFHADWCGSCKALGPKMAKARGKADLDSANVLFVKLDLTDKTTSHQASLLASALGVADFYKENNGKTGFILLVNSSTGETLGKITKDMDADQIEAKIQENIKSL